MKWTRLPETVPEMKAWGSHRGAFSYVISIDLQKGAAEYEGRYAASAKPLGAMPWDNRREDLGVYDDFIAAERACMRHSRKVQN